MQPQETEGDYFFNGQCLATKGVSDALAEEEIMGIVHDIFQHVKQHEGADYLCVFNHEDGRKIFVIDQLSKSMMDGNGYTKEQISEHNHFTIMFNHEY